MSREIGDYYFNRMFPDQTAPQPAPRKPSLGDRLLKFFLGLDGTKADGEYEYKTVRVPGAKASARRHTQALNRLAAEGWEPVDVQPHGALEFGTKDTVTLRRKR